MSEPGPVAIPFARRNAAHGVLWLRHAFAMLWAYRVRWLLLLLTYYFLILAIDLVPYVGAFVAPLLKPVFAVGFLAAAWSQERGEAPAIRHLFAGFRANLRALLLLGIVFVVGMTVAIFATSLMPILLALWFAPALVVFQDCGGGRALATSLRAAMANARPIAVYALLIFLYGGALPAFVAKIIAVMMPLELAKTVVLVALLPYLALLVATLHISDYVSYRDLFHPDESAAPADAPAGEGHD